MNSGVRTRPRLTCGHVSPSQPAYRTKGTDSRARSYWCGECGTFRRRK